MKVSKIDRKGNRREVLLKEYFLTASLLALFKRGGDQAAKATAERATQASPVKVRY